MTAEDKNRKFADRAVGAAAIQPEVRDGKDTKRWKKRWKNSHNTQTKKIKMRSISRFFFFLKIINITRGVTASLLKETTRKYNKRQESASLIFVTYFFCYIKKIKNKFAIILRQSGASFVEHVQHQLPSFMATAKTKSTGYKDTNNDRRRTESLLLLFF